MRTFKGMMEILEGYADPKKCPHPKEKEKHVAVQEYGDNSPNSLGNRRYIRVTCKRCGSHLRDINSETFYTKGDPSGRGH